MQKATSNDTTSVANYIQSVIDNQYQGVPILDLQILAIVAKTDVLVYNNMFKWMLIARSEETMSVQIVYNSDKTKQIFDLLPESNHSTKDPLVRINMQMNSLRFDETPKQI